VLRIAAIALALAGLSLDLPSAGAQSMQVTIRSHNDLGGKCVDVPGGAGKAGVRLVMWTCHGGPNQVFEHDRTTGLLRIAGLCVDAFLGKSKTTEAGDAVGLWTCHGNDNQRWKIGQGDAATGHTIELAGGQRLCLDVANNNPADGTLLIVWQCHARSNQRFRLSSPVERFRRQKQGQ
jgi:hypothetical protein